MFTEGTVSLKVMLHEMSWPEAKEYFARCDIAILPVGSNEQHGPANSLGTDHLIAQRIAQETARRTGVLCLQVVPFGVSSHHKHFWGTIWIGREAFREYVREICMSLKYYGVRRIVVVNGHGGNLDALTELSRELREDGIFVSVFQWWSASGKLLPSLFESVERRHASAEETSMNLALHPELVDMDKAVDDELSEHALQTEGTSLPFGTLDYTSSGVFGKISTASAEKGKKVFEAVVAELVKHVSLLRDAKVADLAEREKV